MTVNAASRATVNAVGLRYVRTFPDDEGVADGLPDADQGGVEYELTRDEWLTSNPDPRASPPSDR